MLQGQDHEAGYLDKKDVQKRSMHMLTTCYKAQD